MIRKIIFAGLGGMSVFLFVLGIAALLASIFGRWELASGIGRYSWAMQFYDRSLIVDVYYADRTSELIGYRPLLRWKQLRLFVSELIRAPDHDPVPIGYEAHLSFAWLFGLAIALGWYPTLTSYDAIRRLLRRRRGLCLKCGYNLAGNVTGVCPECGTAFERKPQA